jgi:hypothetical protein
MVQLGTIRLMGKTKELARIKKKKKFWKAAGIGNFSLETTVYILKELIL